MTLPTLGFSTSTSSTRIFSRITHPAMPPVLMPRPMVGGAGCIPPTPYFLIICDVLALARAAHLKLSAF